jgi:hypothetical protein
MAWTNIANANLDIGAPIRSVDILALRDNVSAVPNGDTGAPRVRAEALNGGQSGSAPIYAARAWVNFDGTGTFSPNPSTSKIRASGNVSSITKNGTGNYTVNFATAMADANYSAQLVGRKALDGVSGNFPSFYNISLSAGSVQVASAVLGNNASDSDTMCVAIFR